jgi:endonuclease YncB( thermonuclease family)
LCPPISQKETQLELGLVRQKFLYFQSVQFTSLWGAVKKRITALLGTLALAWFIPSTAETISGRVVGVSDGDTITVLSAGHQQTRVRLAQIDAPEKRQDFGAASKDSLSNLVFGKQVAVEVATTDKYGRTVGKVLVSGLETNLEQVKRGMAWVYRQYASDPAYFAAEETARKARAGLWSQSNPIPPWEFRHTKNRSGTNHGNVVICTMDAKQCPDGSFVSRTGPNCEFAPCSAESPKTSVPNSGPRNSIDFSCGSKYTCGQMSTCAEAQFYLEQCGLRKLDRDGDGVPCESICK